MGKRNVNESDAGGVIFYNGRKERPRAMPGHIRRRKIGGCNGT